MPSLLKRFFLAGILVFFFSLPFQKAQAASLQAVSDTISTSRPSAANTLSANQAANATQIQVVDLGQSAETTMYLASDSATFWNDGSSETLDGAQNVASMSAQISGSPNSRYIYFTGAIPHAHHQGDAVTVAIPAMHKIQFTTISAIPTNGKIVISFPSTLSSDINLASPSASTFMFNQLTTGNAGTYIKTNNASSCTWTVVTGTGGGTPSITCQTNSTISSGTVVTFLIGCTTNSGANCTAQNPFLINPTKSFTAASGAADSWTVSIQTQDNNSVALDNSVVKVGTVESVQVQATVQPTLTFTILGWNSGTNITGISASCGSITPNSGINTTPTSVNLGYINNAQVTTAAQELQVATNGSTGYAITATSSGQLKNPATGQNIPDANTGNGLTNNDTPVPATITAGNAAFGIHACGPDSNVNTDQWVNAGTISTGKFSNPWNATTAGYYNTIASHTSGPVNTTNTAVVYAATVNATTPAGVYTTVMTYTATATF